MDIFNSTSPLLATSWFQSFADFNLILLILGGCSVISIAIFMERLITLRRARTNIKMIMPRIRHALSKGEIPEAVRICEKSGGSVAKILQAGLVKHNKEKAQIESAMEVTGMMEIAQLEGNAKVLSIIAHVAPLIGLLGTVLGFIQAFGEMSQAGMMDITVGRVGAAMEYALETTAAGLVVAIPAVIAYNYIVSRIEGYLLDFQSTSTEVVDLLVNLQD